ncbi:xanthine dehydrogenase family protein molybdopterin-binding subunit [Pyxidicoccus fallax]|uniref:Xanthine dehydrogenase family protein molybdopterin-binding subunit n=1 Tax=Pyxidicoccus fallax TaxID=394095 RepID=A0A848LMR6_9BACT|nr:xanthine dehydrogenase family protein molybdopterin-binding subunit [Pyxidicoccus fallax]NMO18960.1 xanthine dehydrogenase family protein molybdopterin-binding subunit [Pyxidicoccus fallax]NPC79459.1 xanthine dehydrogenase family protein molybdopterin-binding subunit [Pyxidicoccus fallax]
MTTPSTQLGRPVNRVDGRAKVTGEARYAGEFNVPGLLYGQVVSSTIARGRIKSIDASEALRLPGVLRVFTHENRPSLPWFDRKYRDDDAPSGSPFRPLHNDKVVYSGQPVALVVAETFELARHAASLVRIEYKPDSHETDLRAQRKKAYAPRQGKDGFEPPPKPWGHADKALDKAAVKVDAEYETPVEHHNPMEPHASTVIHEDDGTLTIYDKTQGVLNSQTYVCNVFDLPKEQVRVRSPFVGGAFGSGLRPQYQLFLAVLAARELKRSVRVTLTREQMFTFGHRPATLQRVALGASADGTLEALIHEAVSETSSFEDYIEVLVNWGSMLYRCDNVRADYKVAALDCYTPIDMRAPGAAIGVYALESAMDELAHALRMDPIALRLKNYSERDQNKDKPYSSKELRACYQQGAERFGWARRNPEPRSMREGHELVGWGMATGIWDAMQQPASAKAVLGLDGRLVVSSATADIGTGTYTVMTQIAADTLGLPIESVTFKLGDSSLPMAPLEGGSWTVASVGSAVKEACEKLREQLVTFARKTKGSPLAGVGAEEVVFAEGQLRNASDPSRAVSIVEAMRLGGVTHLEEQTSAVPSPKQQAYTRCVHSAVFAEVKVDEALGTVRVTRVVSAVAGGRVLNPKTARSQVMGGVVWGISMALHEETALDHTLGRFMNHNYAEYHVPVNADVRDIDVIFVDEDDTVVNPLGAKGLGEIGIVGVAAAVANAVFHATGRRVRGLPITLDKLL